MNHGQSDKQHRSAVVKGRSCLRDRTADSVQPRTEIREAHDAGPARLQGTWSAQLSGEWKPSQPGDTAGRGQWWERFNDPELNQLEEKLNISNQNIIAATANVLAARAMIREARAQYFPTVTANPAITNSRLATGFGQTIGVSFRHVLAAARSLLGARFMGPRSKHSQGQYPRGASQRGGSRECPPVRAIRSRHRLL